MAFATAAAAWMFKRSGERIVLGALTLRLSRGVGFRIKVFSAGVALLDNVSTDVISTVSRACEHARAERRRAHQLILSGKHDPVRYPVRFYLLHPGKIIAPEDFKDAKTKEHFYVLGTLPSRFNEKPHEGTFVEAGLIDHDRSPSAGTVIAQIHNPLAAPNEHYAVLELNAKQ